MNEIKLLKAERDLLRFAALERKIGTQTNALDIDTRRTKGNARLREAVAHLRELGLVRGIALTEAGFARGLAEQERVEAGRRKAVSA